MRSSPNVSSSGSRVHALQRSTGRSSWSASVASSRTPACVWQTWRDASTNWRASLPRPSSRRSSRMRRWAGNSLHNCSLSYTTAFFFIRVSCGSSQSLGPASKLQSHAFFVWGSRRRTQVTLFIKCFLSCLQVNDGDSEDTDLQIFCVSCSHPINPKVALRHMERCYAKVIISLMNVFASKHQI